ncbi:5104_t:CDS:2, partial [Cetraspora pellucida]
LSRIKRRVSQTILFIETILTTSESLNNMYSGLITEFYAILEEFAYFTYKYTEGYLVVYGLQDVNLHGEFLLTDSAIHCVDLLRFGKTNLGKSRIKKCFLTKHKCNYCF